MNPIPDYSRRHFLKTSSLIAAGALSSNLVFAKGKGKALKNKNAAASGSFTPNSDTLKIGLVGCGGRGTGAAANALNADKNVVLTAMADAFDDQLQNSLKGLKATFGDRVKVDPDHQFTGFDAYKKLIDSGVDVVLLASPPGFRPSHLTYAVEKGKHIFTEKPMATDAPGVRAAMEAVKKAKEKKLCLVAGFCWRYHQPKRETFQRMHDGAIGDLRLIYTTYNTGRIGKESSPFTRANTKSQMEWMMRRWYFFTWLSGDHLVEQAVHSLDKMSWAMNDVPPLRVMATGGRQVRTEPENGHIYDHFALTYDYPNDVKGFHFCRQQDHCDGGVIEQFSGTKGICKVQGDNHSIVAAKDHWYGHPTNWRFKSEKNFDMYQTEHDELFAAIRAGKVINDGDRMMTSTMLAIMGRMSAYTGKQIMWEDALNSKEILVPANPTWDLDIPTPQVAMPGKTPFV